MLKILFLCTGNSCRSQMAEGWARHLKGDQIEPYSAGVETHGLNPLAVKAMAEAGVDISGHRSKQVDELREVAFDHVSTSVSTTHPGWPRAPRAKRRPSSITAACATRSRPLSRPCPTPSPRKYAP
jgi:arsenate reductase